jgi:antitoxin ParD1/3/4
MTQRFSIRTASMWFADLNGRPENLMMFSWPNWVSAVSQVVMIGLDIMCIKSMLMHDTPRKDMPSAERMTITMPSDMAEALRQTVAGGEFASTSEVVGEALREWTRSRNAELRDLETLRDAIKAGLDSGPGIPADQVFAELRARYADKS